MSKINKEDFDKLYDEEITNKEYKRIINLIDIRVDEIVQKISKPYKNYSQVFYYYSNGEYDYDSGNFDPEEYKENIKINYYEGFCIKPFDGEFPTRWLYEDFEEEMQQIIKNHEEYKLSQMTQKQKKLLKNKEKKDTMIQSIKSKLNSEELKFLKIK